ncbi:hydrolase [Staphylococcus auricularis]|uniref:Alpha/beta hydrolase n=1 Tax=Staphylococcus auricularis TaxID=29379 RepID=A0AAP8PNT0_9STAP|nr:alpha/beta hydrolase [Staphylococcus auricularis]PNZ67358.1 alpha/beta hydrolase [Staphylococcus auricularis]QPT06384.1 alpha/beta hydrolase [Staphylococcus auricularis]BCU53213.1 hydrolase [Staphylococcus auricularis]SQJ16525.1 alpha/beta hydrolase [Staphylococcus auricularis]
MIEKSIRSTEGSVYYWTNDINISTEVAIVFCHGLTADHTLFDKQVQYLAHEYKLITWDLPLHGKSRPYRNFSFSNVNKELLAIFKKENINKIIFVGQSEGGFIAQSFANDFKDKVIGFIGIGTTPLGRDYYKKSELFWIKHFSTIAKCYPYRCYTKTAANAITVTDEAKKSMLNSLNKLGKNDMLRAARAVYEEFLKVRDEVQFDCPVLITYGEHDKTGYIKKYCHHWSSQTGHPIRVISHASHNANYDNYKDFNAILVSFVETL